MKRLLSVFLAIVMIGSCIPVSYASGLPFIDDPDAISDSSYSVVMLFCYDINGELISTGSAFAAIENGLFVTNYHVIEGIDSIVANTEGGMYFDITEILAVDPENDVALLKTKARTGMTLLPVGSAYGMKKGSKVVAIGSPIGLVNSVSSGLCSGIIEDEGQEFIQFDAAISNGSSGGALFNNNGEVIGITSASFTEGNNLNLAVPIERATELWERYLAGETEEYVPEDSSPRKIFEVGSRISLGECYQDKDRTEYKPIEWVVIGVEENRALIVTRYNLMYWEYYTNIKHDGVYIDWKNSELRKYLNGDFLKCFSDDELDKLIPYDTTRNSAKDKLFILSVEEVNKYLPKAEDRICTPTEFVSKNVDSPIAGCFWQLRLDSVAANQIWAVDECGIIQHGVFGLHSTIQEGGIRVAAWIDLDKY